MKNTKNLTILHNNDIHGDFFDEKIGDLNVGGLSTLSGYISHARENDENVVYVIAGDMFRGSIIDSEFQGVSTIEMINMISPDIVTIGNHEIDYGISHLLFIEKCAQFPIINANLYIKVSGARLFTPYKILDIDGMKVLFIGIITEEIIAQARAEGLVGSFIDTAEAALEIGKICNAYNAIDIDFTVLVTHIGIEEDIKLAKLLDPVWGVDIIIGGHSHTFMEEPLIVNDIVIAHAGEGTDVIGRFDIVVDTDLNSIDSFKWELVPINQTTAEKDHQLEQLLYDYKEITDRKYQRIITRFNKALTHPRRNMETQLGCLFADIFQESMGVDIMVLGSGSIRSDKLGPIVELGTLSQTFPYNDPLYMMQITGKQLQDMILHVLRDDAWLDITEYYQFSQGFKVLYSKSDRVIQEISLNNKKIDDKKLYTIGVQNYHFLNMDDFLNLDLEEVSKNQTPRVITTASLDIIVEFLTSRQKFKYQFEPRVTILD